jgi:APA family basic amino acid/polyamine antiporter
MLIVGNIIGIGIFTTTGYISQYLPSSGYMLLLWIVGGVLSICGGVTYAELSSRFPVAGGDFHFLTAAYHPLMGFLFGWSTLLVTYTGSIAVIAVGFAHYFLNFFPETFRNIHFIIPLLSLKLDLIKIFAILIIIIFTVLNIRGIRSGAIGQTVLTIGGILVLILFILGSCSGWCLLHLLWLDHIGLHRRRNKKTSENYSCCHLSWGSNRNYSLFFCKFSVSVCVSHFRYAKRD